MCPLPLQVRRARHIALIHRSHARHRWRLASNPQPIEHKLTSTPSATRVSHGSHALWHAVYPDEERAAAMGVALPTSPSREARRTKRARAANAKKLGRLSLTKPSGVVAIVVASDDALRTDPLA